jgi:hypothetical protein
MKRRSTIGRRDEKLGTMMMILATQPIWRSTIPIREKQLSILNRSTDLSYSSSAIISARL